MGSSERLNNFQGREGRDRRYISVIFRYGLHIRTVGTHRTAEDLDLDDFGLPTSVFGHRNRFQNPKLEFLVVHTSHI